MNKNKDNKNWQDRGTSVCQQQENKYVTQTLLEKSMTKCSRPQDIEKLNGALTTAELEHSN